MINIFKHLLPRARAWRITVTKTLKQFFEGLAVALIDDTKTNIDNIWTDINPETTTKLNEWESQFGLSKTLLLESDRRSRLAATWQALGGQDVSYIQSTLRNNGFDVYIHEWWDPITTPTPGVKSCAVSRNPRTYLRDSYTGTTILLECGEPLAECGEYTSPRGYPLVNKITKTEADLSVLCGEPLAECGEPDAECGMFFNYRDFLQNYNVPNDPALWPYFLYIGGETFGELAIVEPSRRNEFEALCLKIAPCHIWLGMLINYT